MSYQSLSHFHGAESGDRSCIFWWEKINPFESRDNWVVYLTYVCVPMVFMGCFLGNPCKYPCNVGLKKEFPIGGTFDGLNLHS